MNEEEKSKEENKEKENALLRELAAWLNNGN